MVEAFICLQNTRIGMIEKYSAFSYSYSSVRKCGRYNSGYYGIGDGMSLSLSIYIYARTHTGSGFCMFEKNSNVSFIGCL